MNTKMIIAIVVCILVISSSAFAYVQSNNSKKRAAQVAAEAEYKEQLEAHHRAVAAARSAEEQRQKQQQTEGPKPTTTPPTTVQNPHVVYITDPYTRPTWRGGVDWDVPRRRIPLYPGGSIDAVVGRKKDSATSYLMTTYPSLALRVIPHGTVVTFEARSDRVTVVYDPYTERVISAIIG